MGLAPRTAAKGKPRCCSLGRGFGFSLCLAVVRWAVDHRTAARATPVVLPVGVILGLLSGDFRVAFGCFRVLSGVRLHALAYAVACAGGWFWCSTVFHAWRCAPLASAGGLLSRLSQRAPGK